MSSVFERFDPALQYQIVYGLGFQGLRPVQELGAEAVLDGCNAVVLAPTAGGKTEAAFFPLLSLALSEGWAAPSILYVTPIKALINNQEERLTHLTALLGRKAFKWHGDVSDSRRKAFQREPADVLLTTPESIEAMLISRRVSNETMFRNLRAVVIDEVHAFAGDDRGGHLVSLLSRLTRLCGRDLQRIGLSATVGNPETILDWVQGSSTRPRRMVSPPKPKTTPHIEIDFVGTLENAALVIEKLHAGRKRLVFADSRRKVETLGRELDKRGVRTFVMHSSLSASERALAEREFAEGRNCVVLATSAMELGIDVGDLDHVLQIDSPATVAAFLQRMGRTGRRSGTTANCTFLCTDPQSLLQAAAIVSLQNDGFVEPVKPVTDGAHLYAHQVLALAMQEGGIDPSDIAPWLEGSAILERMLPGDEEAIRAHMLAEEILIEVDGLLCLGPKGEKLYGAKNYLEMYAVFEATQDFTVFSGRNEIGQVAALWVAQKGRSGAEFTLGGKPWIVQAIEYTRRRIDVVRGGQGGSVGWIGRPRVLGFELTSRMGELLRDEGRGAGWTDRAWRQIEALRDEFANVPADGLERLGADFRWHTFAGAGANTILSAMVEEELGQRAAFDNLTVTIPAGSASGQVDPARLARVALDRGAALGESELVAIGRKMDSEVLGKFAPCLPPAIRGRVLATRLLDQDGVMRLRERALHDSA